MTESEREMESRENDADSTNRKLPETASNAKLLDLFNGSAMEIFASREE